MDEEEVKVEEEVKKVILSVTSDSVKGQGAARRNSTGKANARTSPTLLSSDEKILPHYLRASTNSCHEFCKYGKKHVFEPKKRKPNLRRDSGSSEIPAEGQKAEFSAPRVRRTKPELKAKTEPKDGLLEKPKATKQNGLKEIHPGTHVVEETEPFKVPESMKLPTPPSQGHIASLEHSPFEKDEESSAEPASIEIVTPLPVHQIEELSDASESSSPTEKRVISHEPTTHIAWSEKPSDGSESMDVELPSSIRTPKSQVEGSSEEPLGVEILAPAPGIEIMAHADESIRSNSAAPSSAEKSLKAIPPTRRSTSSAKARPPIREEKLSEKVLSAKLKTPSPNPRSFAGNEEVNRMKNLNNVEGKKREVNKVKARPQLETVVSENAKVVREKRIGVIAKPTVVKKTIPSPVEKRTVTPVMPRVSERKSPVSESAKVVREKRIGVIAKPTVVKKTIPSPVEKRTVTPVKPKVSERKCPPSIKKVIIPVSPRVAKQKTSPTVRRTDTPSKPLMSLKPKAPAVKSTPSRISLRRLSAQRNTGNKIIRSIDLSKLGEDATPKPSRASISTKPSVGTETTSAKLMKSRGLKPSSAAKVQRKCGKLENTGAKEKEKTLYVIEPKTLKSGPKSTRKGLKKNREHSSSHASSSSSSSSSSVSSHEKEENEDAESTLSEASQLVLNKENIKRIKPVQSAKSEEKRTLIRTSPATVRTEARVPSPHKLNFRRGKIVSPVPENNTPRKLKFRKAKGTGENSKEAVRRTFRRRRVSCGSASELIAPSLGAPEVVLRHQDVQEKKDVQGLFNHVIEETANKLVEAKKSKVKALVGAFETVISLQERRVSPTV